MNWILITVIYIAGEPHTSKANFKTKDACEAQKVEWLKEAPQDRYKEAYCVPVVEGEVETK